MAHIWDPRPNLTYQPGSFSENSKINIIHGPDNAKLLEKSSIRRTIRKKHIKYLARTKTLNSLLPIIVNDKGQLILLNITRDAPNIGILGQKGEGKTVMYISLLGSSYHNCNIRCGIISCQTKESLTWSKANQTTKFLKKLEILKQKGIGLPIVGLFPHIKDSIPPKQESCPILKISYNWKDFLKHPGKLKDLKGSNDYFDLVMNELQECTTYEQVSKVIESRTMRNKKKDIGTNEEKAEKMKTIIEKGGLPVLTANKLKAIIKKLMDKEIFDITSNLPSKLTVRTKKGIYKDLEPFSACMLTRLIPSLLTSELSQEENYESWFINFLEKIYFSQTKPGQPFHDNNLTIWLFCDEINGIPPKLEIVKRIFRTGRPSGIGFVWSCQEPEDLDPTITSQTKTFIVFKSGKKELSALNKCHLTEQQIRRIEKLKPFQACLITDEPVTVYDPKNNKYTVKSISNNPQFGGIVFPTSQPRVFGGGEEGVVEV